MKNNFRDIYGMADPSCIYKFAWSTIHLYAKKTNSCHRVEHDTLTINNIDDFHNTPLKLQTRQDMIDGKWPNHGCEYCKKIEDVGGISDRIKENSNDNILHFVPPELLKEKNSINISPTIVEVFFSNLCNMACLYCNSDYSTVWENEDIKFNLKSQKELNKHIEQKKDYPVLLEKFWMWLEKNASTLVEYNVLGGEPFFQPEFEQNIEFFEKNPCPNLIFTIFSNFKVSNIKFRKILDRIGKLVDKKHIREFRIFASIDAWGPQEEYVRYGLDLVQWEENFKTMVESYPNIRLVIHATMCNLTIKTYPELIEKINEYNNIRIKNNLPLVGISFSFADAMTYLRTDIFPKGFFDDDFDKMIEVAPTKLLKQRLLGFRDTINSQPYCPDLIRELKIQLDDIDKRRNLNWKPLFPWLDEFIIN